MPVRAEKLVQRIQLIHDLAIARFQFTPQISSVIQTLEQLVSEVERKTLTLHIIQVHPLETQAVVNEWISFLKTSPSLAAAYTTKCWDFTKTSAVDLLYDCDVACFVIDTAQGISDSAKQAMIAARTHLVTERLLIFPQAGDRAEASLSALKSIASEFAFELFSLPLSSSGRESSTKEQRSLEQLSKRLEGLVRRKPEDILAQRLAKKAVAQITYLEQELECSLNWVIQETQQSEQAYGQDAEAAMEWTLELKAQLEQDLREIQDSSKVRFKQIKAELDSSKKSLLDEFNRRSLVHQIQRFISELQPRIIRRGRSKYIQLQSDFACSSADINMDMVQLCYDYLSQWAIAEWQRVYSLYHGRGINQLFRKLYTVAQSYSTLALDEESLQPTHIVADLERFREPVAGVVCESYYKEVSLGGYFVRQLRNQWMGIMFLFAFLTMVGIADNKQAIISSLLKPFHFLKDNPLWLTVALVIPFFLLFFFLLQGYDDNGEHKINDEAEKLKKGLRDYYQKFAAYKVERLVDELNTVLDREETHLGKTLAEIRETVQQQWSLVEQQHAIAQQRNQSLIAKQKELEKLKAELQKLKQL
jgi:hypothetical protein